MSFSSDEVNYLIFRYMKEAGKHRHGTKHVYSHLIGFQHSAFTFGYESSITNADVDPSDVGTGALISIIQKGLLYQEMEAQINDKVCT